jgi:transposase
MRGDAHRGGEGGVGLQIIRDWVLRFNARGPAGLLDGKSPGQPPKLNDVQRQAIAQMIDSGPIPAAHGVVRWRLIDLAQWFYEEFRITIAKQTLSRELRAMGYRKLSARPSHHAQVEGAIEDFKKTSALAWTKLPAKGGRRRGHRDLVPGRSAHRPEEQDHAPLGEARFPPQRAPRSAHRLDLHLRRCLPRAGQGRRTDLARLQHRGDEPASRRDRRGRRAWRSRRAPARSGRLAYVDAACRSAQRHHHRPAAQMPRAQPGGQRLAVDARQSALKPDLAKLPARIIHPLSLLRSSATRAQPVAVPKRTAKVGTGVVLLFGGKSGLIDAAVDLESY